MRFNKTKFAKSLKSIIYALILLAFIFNSINSGFAEIKSKNGLMKYSEEKNELEENLPAMIDLNKIPNFPKSNTRLNNGQNGVINIDSSVKIIVETYIDPKTAKIGDPFRGHLYEDFYSPFEPRQLIVPKGSWVRGKISFLKKPGIFNKAGKISIHLDRLITSLGDITSLDSELEIHSTLANQPSVLNLLNLPNRQDNSQNLVPQSINVSSSNINEKLFGSLMEGKLQGFVFQGDSPTLIKGQEILLSLKKQINISSN